MPGPQGGVDEPMLTLRGSRMAPLLMMVAVAGAMGGITAAAGPTPADGPAFTGVNLSGAEFASQKQPGVYGRDYIYPNPAEIDFFLSRGLNVFRIPFLWERLDPGLGGPLDGAELQRLQAVVSYATAKGASIILDPHNYARYRGAEIGGADVPNERFAVFWGRLAALYKGNDRVIFGLMNEPFGEPAEQWRDSATAALRAIRQAGAKNLVLVPGVAWTGAHSFVHGHYGTPNAVALRDIADPAGNYVYEVHQYLDSDYSGTHPACQSPEIGVATLREMTVWLRDNHKRGFLGEFGASADATCLAALTAMLAFMRDNADVWLGWTYWTAGPWMGKYQFSVEPGPGGEGDLPQLAILQHFTHQPRSTAP
jgi:endoglucanase